MSEAELKPAILPELALAPEPAPAPQLALAPAPESVTEIALAPASPEPPPAPNPRSVVAVTSADPPVGLDEVSLEALLFVAEKPLTRREIAGLAGIDRHEVDARLGDLEVSLRDRGIRLVISGDRVELATAPEAGRLIARYLGVDVVRLSPAALETLAIVAYRQPITKAAVERIRGVDSDYSIRALLHRRLVVELGRSEAPGRPILYGTGFEFLERFGLTSLDALPVLDSLVASRLVEEAAPAITRPLAGPTVGAAADGESVADSAPVKDA